MNEIASLTEHECMFDLQIASMEHMFADVDEGGGHDDLANNKMNSPQHLLTLSLFNA